MESSLCEKPERHDPRRLSDYLMLEGQMQKVHSLVDKVYARKNLKLAWERVVPIEGQVERMGLQSKSLKPIWTRIWNGCIKSFETEPISRSLCDD